MCLRDGPKVFVPYTVSRVALIQYRKCVAGERACDSFRLNLKLLCFLERYDTPPTFTVKKVGCLSAAPLARSGVEQAFSGLPPAGAPLTARSISNTCITRVAAAACHPPKAAPMQAPSEKKAACAHGHMFFFFSLPELHWTRFFWPLTRTRVASASVRMPVARILDFSRADGNALFLSAVCR